MTSFAVLWSVLLPVVLTGALADTGAAAPIAPPLEQIAANCDRPTYASDMLVCGDPSLRALDARMQDAWRAVDVTAVAAPGARVETQQAWIRRRRLCAFAERHADCVQAAYLERIAVLEVMRLEASRPPPSGALAVCPEEPWGEGPVRVDLHATVTLALQDGEARVLATATPLTPPVTPITSDSVWRPYVGFAIEGRTLRLQPIEGPAIICRMLDGP